MIMQTPERLKNYLSTFGKKYPTAWKTFGDFRQDRGIT
jgi:hypothetical protein